MWMLIDGCQQTQLAAVDRGLSYGDGLFETIKVIQSRPLLWKAHWQRLQAGCQRLGLPVDDSLEQLLLSELEQLLAASALSDATWKVTLTRGPGQRGYLPPLDQSPTRICQLSALPDFSAKQQGVVLRRCQTPLAINPLLAGIKHLNRLEQVLARAEWRDDTISEGVVLDTEGYVVEGTMSNLFWLRDGQLYTPCLEGAGVAGVVRTTLLQQLAKHSPWPVNIGRYRFAELASADQLVVCNSLIDLWPVVTLIDDQQQIDYPLGSLYQQLSNMLSVCYTEE